MAKPRKRTILIELPSKVSAADYARMFNTAYAVLPDEEGYSVTADHNSSVRSLNKVWNKWHADRQKVEMVPVNGNGRYLVVRPEVEGPIASGRGVSGSAGSIDLIDPGFASRS